MTNANLRAVSALRSLLLSSILLILCTSAALAADRIFGASNPGPQGPIVVEAHVIEASRDADGALIAHAVGDVLFQQGMRFLRGDEFYYNGAVGTGLVRNASFTTCSNKKPDYRITAREILLRPDQRVVLRHASLYLGRLRLISMPDLTLKVGGGGGNDLPVPVPGFNNRDGFTLLTTYPVLQTGQNDFSLRLNFTQNRAIQGGISGGRAIVGNALASPAYVPDCDTELRRVSILRPELNEQESVSIFRGQRAETHLVSLFGALISRSAAVDIDQPGLLVSREPEVGVKVIMGQAGLGDAGDQPKLGIQGQIRASWGNFKESAGSGSYIGRSDIRGTGSIALAKLGKSTALRGVGLARYSAYETGQTYRVLGASLDVSRTFPGGSFVSLRLINHWTGGSTPFFFDDIDIKREVQGAIRYVRGRNIFTTLLDYDMSERKLRSWQFTIGHRMDCMEPSIGFSTSLRGVILDLKVLGL